MLPLFYRCHCWRLPFIAAAHKTNKNNQRHFFAPIFLYLSYNITSFSSTHSGQKLFSHGISSLIDAYLPSLCENDKDIREKLDLRRETSNLSICGERKIGVCAQMVNLVEKFILLERLKALKCGLCHTLHNNMSHGLEFSLNRISRHSTRV